MRFDTSDYEKILESDFLRFIDTTPASQNPTWVLIAAVEEGNGGIEYNPNVDRIKFIVNKNASSNHTSNDKSMEAPYLAYKGDPCFEFANGGRDKLNYKTHFLEVDIWDETTGSYSAKMSNATMVINSYDGNMINFTINEDGDPVEGSVTMSGNTPTFTPTTSL